jgi:MSHA biogenesis protein MshO
MPRQQGFTLVELVMVIVLLGIVATISTQFVSFSVRGAIDLGDRQQRALQGVVISEQITRELRGAFPLSVRGNDECLEWLPILGATAYTSLPADSPTVNIRPFGKAIEAGARLIVYGYGPQKQLYETGSSVPNPGPVSPKIEKVEFDAEKVSLVANHRFNARSPQKRLYAVGGPVSVCRSDDRQWLYRYSNYNSLTTEQPTTLALAALAQTSALTREVMSANLDPENSLAWRVTPPSFKRAAVVSFAFTLKAQNSNETTRVSQEVHIRNVP